MYESFYKLKDEPFRLSPDPSYCYKHRSYVKAEGYLRYGVQRAEGIVMITGAPGTGKSTLVSELLADFTPSKVLIGTLVVTRLDTDNLFRAVAYALNLTVEGMDRASVLRCLELYLTEQAQKGKRALLVVDEAQNLTIDGLEDLRLLTNLQMGHRPLLQVFLLGQESLREKVRDAALKQLLQRIIAACHLEPLEADETRDYIMQRLERAGWQGNPSITEDAFALIHRHSSGIPRRINQLCSRMFLYGAVDEKHILDATDAQAVLDDFRNELLMPDDEQTSVEEITRAQARSHEDALRAHARGAKSNPYQPRIVSDSGRPIEGGRAEANRPPGAAERLVIPSSIKPAASRAVPAEENRPLRAGASERREASPPRLQAVSSTPIKEALRALADDDTLPPTVLNRQADDRSATAPDDLAAPVPRREPEAAPVDERLSLYVDSHGERRVRGPGPRVGGDDDYKDRYEDRNSPRHPWVKMLLVIVLLLVSVYVASPLIKERFGIDIAGAVHDQIAVLTGAGPAAAPAAAQAPNANQPAGNAAASEGPPSGAPQNAEESEQ
jgi:type II secretory pathway predicted ATPase ExeA